MAHLVLEIGTEKRAYFDSQIMLGPDGFLIGEEKYQLLMDGMIFEWYFSPEGTVTGVELMLDKSDFENRGIPLPLRSESWLQNHGSAVFWFTDRREGRPRCLQDWEGYVYKTSLGRELVALRTHMLSEEELENLMGTISMGRDLHQ